MVLSPSIRGGARSEGAPHVHLLPMQMKNGLDMEIWDHKRFVIRPGSRPFCKFALMRSFATVW